MKSRVVYVCDCPPPGKKYNFGAFKEVNVNKDGTCVLCEYYAVKQRKVLG